MATDKHIPLTEAPLTEAESKRLLELLDALAGALGMPHEWGAGTRMAQFAFDTLRIRFLIRNATPAQNLDAEEARINGMVEAAAIALGALAADASIPALVRLPLLGMLAESADDLAQQVINEQAAQALQPVAAAPGGAA